MRESSAVLCPGKDKWLIHKMRAEACLLFARTRKHCGAVQRWPIHGVGNDGSHPEWPDFEDRVLF